MTTADKNKLKTAEKSLNTALNTLNNLLKKYRSKKHPIKIYKKLDCIFDLVEEAAYVMPELVELIEEYSG